MRLERERAGRSEEGRQMEWDKVSEREGEEERKREREAGRKEGREGGREGGRVCVYQGHQRSYQYYPCSYHCLLTRPSFHLGQY